MVQKRSREDFRILKLKGELNQEEVVCHEWAVCRTFPDLTLRLDDTVMDTRDGWAAWKDDGSYQKAFERLPRDLKATGGRAPLRFDKLSATPVLPQNQKMDLGKGN